MRAMYLCLQYVVSLQGHYPRCWSQQKYFQLSLFYFQHIQSHTCQFSIHCSSSMLNPFHCFTPPDILSLCSVFLHFLHKVILDSMFHLLGDFTIYFFSWYPYNIALIYIFIAFSSLSSHIRCPCCLAHFYFHLSVIAAL